ncbi:MAG: CotH kinase family protein [Muribaculaceae bacterium]|nr:CotH kinase family protein [Muribaculaceae bacterium]
MRKIILLVTLVCAMCYSPKVHADTSSLVAVRDTMIELSEIISTGLITINVETVDGEEPTCDYVSAPPGSMGKTITNATKVPGRLVIYGFIEGVDSLLYDSGDYVKDVSGMTIKIRGNTSAYSSKKPYKIKLQKKSDLLFRGNEDLYKDKEWLLLKFDYLLAFSGFKINEMMGLPWTPGHRFVNVVMNGVYRGVYMMCESVKRNPSCRLNVDKLTGYIFECDPYWWNEDVYVNSITSPSYNFTFKYPDSEDITPEQLEYIQGVVTNYENSLTQSYYPDLIDVESFAEWCLGHDLEGTQDSGGANRYYTKYDSTDTSKIHMPLLWDFDMAERMKTDWSLCHTQHFKSLFNNANRTFVDEYVGLWRSIEKTFFNTMQYYLSRFETSSEGVALNKSLSYEGLLWNTTLDSLHDIVTDRIIWYNTRNNWMKKKMKSTYPVGDTNLDGVVDISDVTSLIDMLLGTSTMYRHAADVNLDGQPSISDATTLIDMLLAASK